VKEAVANRTKLDAKAKNPKTIYNKEKTTRQSKKAKSQVSHGHCGAAGRRLLHTEMGGI
jgi:hypothetical protein